MAVTFSKREPVLIKVWDISDKKEPIATIEAGKSAANSNVHVNNIFSRRFSLADGHQIIVEVIVDGKSQSSPIYKP